MQPVNDEQLILFYYGELEAREAESLRARLAADAALTERFSQLAVELDAVPELPAPGRDEFYGRRVWARVDAALENEAAHGSRWFMKLRRTAGALGGVLVVGMIALIAFQLGRHSQLPDENLLANAPAGTGDQQAVLLQASLVNYFGDAERLLTAVSNSETGAVDLEAEKEWAKVLLVANRLYRFAAVQAGQHRIALLLGDMEPVLIELANGAGQLTPEEYRVLRRSIAERDLLFKVRSTNISLKPQSTQL